MNFCKLPQIQILDQNTKVSISSFFSVSKKVTIYRAPKSHRRFTKIEFCYITLIYYFYGVTFWKNMV